MIDDPLAQALVRQRDAALNAAAALEVAALRLQAENAALAEELSHARAEIAGLRGADSTPASEG